jgi:ABC-type amino acid transport substrate-binding protein
MHPVRRQRRLLIIILISGILTSISSPSWPADGSKDPAPVTVTAVILRDFLPVNFQDPQSGKAAGFAVDILDKLAERGGFRVNYQFASNWQEISRKIKDGEADVCPGMGISNERMVQLSFTEPIETSPTFFFVRSQSRAFDEINGKYTVGVMRGGITYGYLKKHPNLNLVMYDGFKSGLFDLLAGTIDAFAGSAPTLLRLARMSGVDDKIKTAGKPIV